MTHPRSHDSDGRAADTFPDFQAALIDAGARRYGRTARTRRLASVVAITATVALAAVATSLISTRGPAPTTSPSDEWTAFVLDRAGLSGAIPPGWQLAGTSQTPSLTDPREALTVATFTPPSAPDNERCQQLPVAAIAAMGPADALVSLQERGRGAAVDKYPSRPARFGPGAGEVSNVVRGCKRPAFTGRVGWYAFRERDRAFYALVALGTHATPQTTAQAFAILDRLRIDPSFQPAWRSAG